MAKDGGENTLGVVARQGKGIGVANAGGNDAHTDFAGLGRGDLNVFDR